MITTFGALPLAPALQQVLAELGLETLTPIQAQSLPPLLEGRDLVGQARTGSGKTAAFALPILQKLSVDDRHLQALVLCPTRELGAQVARELRRLARGMPGVQVLELAGGQPIHRQIEALGRGVHVAVGTPGRVLDHLGRETLALSRVSTVVLDEADRMLDMGFQEEMERILSAAPAKRQTLFFSATYPRSIEAMSARWQREPLRITVEEPADAEPGIEQLVRDVGEAEKPAALLRLLAQERPGAAIVFCNHKATVKELVAQLRDAGVAAAALHGDLEQRDRDLVMARFRNGSERILVATDVAARGIDVADLDLVVNFDLPFQPEDYVHRIGRTGRAGKRGRAIALVTRRDARRLTDLEHATGTKLEPFPDDASRAPPLELGARMETLYISGGRKEKVRPGDILGALTGEAGGLAASEVGRIEIHDHHAWVGVSRPLAKAAAQRLAAGRIKNRRFKVGIAR